MGRNRVRLALAVLPATLLATLSAAPGFAQAPASRYPTPTLSPWFDLYQKHAGPIDNYNMFVRPEMQLRNTLRNQQSEIQFQTTAVTNQAQQISQMEENRRGVAPTGTAAGFMNYGRYFGVSASTGQGASGNTGRAPSRSGRGSWSLPPANSHSGGK
jgi:hypothetical protein